jgi:hypothetical protein
VRKVSGVLFLTAIINLICSSVSYASVGDQAMSHRVTPSLKLKLYAYGMSIQAPRRNQLFGTSDEIVSSFGRNEDLEVLAQKAIAACVSHDESRFVLLAFDELLGKRLGLTYQGRAIIYSQFRLLCNQIMERRMRDA